MSVNNGYANLCIGD